MENIYNQYIQLLTDTGGVYFPGIIQDETKSKDILTPIFETITNALEAIKLKTSSKTYETNNEVNIFLNFSSIEGEKETLDNISVEDTGIGFNYDSFKSFCTYKYNKKGFQNKGCGRFQSLLFFANNVFISKFTENNKTYKIDFDFNKQNMDSKGVNITSFEEIKDGVNQTGTVVKLIPEKDDAEFDDLSIEYLKKEIIKKYALEFSLFDIIPEISISKIVNKKEVKKVSIIKGVDIPTDNQKRDFKVNYKHSDDEGNIVDTLGKELDFKVTFIAFKQEDLDENEIYISCKNEAIQNIGFEAFAPKDNLKGFRYLGFIQSEVFDAPQNIDNCRKEIKNIIKTEEQAYKDIEKVRNLSLFGDFILQEDLENAVKKEFYNLFPDAKEKENEKQQKLKELKDLFGLENNSRITIKTSDSEKDILEKFYRSDSLKQATMDAILKDVFDQLKTLDSNDPEYEKKFEELSNDLNRKIPLRNKNCLSKYMSGRRVALEYFRMALDKELNVQKTKVKGKRNMEEHRLHNSLLKRKCANTSKSNLWMLNDEFIYFTGFSDVPLNQMKNEKGEDIFDFANVTEEERALLENRDDDKPDTILFPSERKCIIIELKKPDVRIDKYINQAKNYARLIASYSKPENKITMFYTYLISDNINLNDIDDDYEQIHNLNAYFCPTKKLRSTRDNSRAEVGYIYSEIISYRDIYKRAELRNKLFFDIIEGRMAE